MQRLRHRETHLCSTQCIRLCPFLFAAPVVGGPGAKALMLEALRKTLERTELKLLVTTARHSIPPYLTYRRASQLEATWIARSFDGGSKLQETTALSFGIRCDLADPCQKQNPRHSPLCTSGVSAPTEGEAAFPKVATLDVHADRNSDRRARVQKAQNRLIPSPTASITDRKSPPSCLGTGQGIAEERPGGSPPQAAMQLTAYLFKHRNHTYIYIYIYGC